MRFESATVPAAVMPDHALRDDGFRNYLPLFHIWEWEGFLNPGQVRRPAMHTCSTLSGIKAKNHNLIPTLIIPGLF